MNPVLVSSIVLLLPNFSARSPSHITYRPLPILPSISMQTFLVLLACLGVVDAAAGVLEVDLVFPRNDTYAPTSLFPVIIAFQNARLVPFLNPKLSLEIANVDDNYQTGVSSLYDMRWANFSSSEPYYELRVFSEFNKEGRWRLAWQVSWDSCTEDSLGIFLGKNIIRNESRHSTRFTIKNSAQNVDLVAATTDRNCSENEGVAISIATTLPVPEGVEWDGGRTCASLSPTTPAPTPCQVKFDSAAASSMSSSITASHCKATQTPGSSCSPGSNVKNAAQQLASGAAAGLAAVFVALGYLLV
jgi:hypothetical protein